MLRLKAGDAQAAASPASTRQEWAQEARKLDLQGKEEQARAIRDTFLQDRPLPWTPWTRPLLEELAPRALEPGHPSAKQKQVLLDYALWHGQQAWIERLARANFLPARRVAPEGDFGQVGVSPVAHLGVPDRARQQQLSLRAVSALRHRHLQAHASKNFKDILRLCDLHGVDHLTPVGGTPLMLAARAGNAALLDALVDRGADPSIEDEFGHTAWQQAVNRAMDEPGFVTSALASVFDRIAPKGIDVQVDGRLVRIERHQGEYWILTLMLAGFKSQWSRCAARSHPARKYASGHFAEQLHQVLEGLPAHLWKDIRRKRSYVNQVLARAEVASGYKPARKLWARTINGHYLPNPSMLLRKGDAWLPVYEALRLDWVDQGTGSDRPYSIRPAAAIAGIEERLSGTWNDLF